MNTYKETIICPECGSIETAFVLHTAPWYSYVHDCLKCGYTIMASDWEQVKQGGGE